MCAKVKTKKQWERLRGEAMAALNDLEAKERRTRAKALVGKCFRYTNSYGSGSRWPLYARVVSVDEHGWLTAFKFETTSNDEIQIEPASTRMSMDSYTPISEAEFRAAWGDLMGRLTGLTAKPASNTVRAA